MWNLFLRVLSLFASLLVRRQRGVEEISMSDNNTAQIKYDVFVSFSGEIRRGFLGHLVDAFKMNKIDVFVDYRLERGEEIWPSLVEAIESSSISLIIFSPKYAYSRWCLKELLRILECKEKYGQIVIPVFYDVQPTNVRFQSGCYENAFAKHGKKHKSMVQIWRRALNQSADISGVELSKFQTDAELIKEIVKLVHAVLKKLDKPLRSNSKGFIGIDRKIAYLESLICKEPKSTRLIGIWGMGGIGKTTLVEKVFNKLLPEYDGYYFLENEGQKFNKRLTTIFSKLLGYDVEIDTPNSLPVHVVRRIRRMKVLIVLDDVNDSELLEKIVGALYNFKSGSRIIVTTRDKHVVNKADEIYSLEEFSFVEALELFNLNAFKQGDNHQREYDELSRSIVYYAKGIPLVVTVLARRLSGKNKEVWESELDKLNKMPPTEAFDVMKLSYDDLECEEQEIFLDLACFILRLHEKVKLDNVKSLLKDEERDISVAVRLERLKDRALITFSEDNFISMHDSLQEMGREIVRRESSKDPGSRKWLWDPNDICHALENDKGAKDIRSIQLDLTKVKKKLGPGMLTKMSGLKFLEIYSGSYQHNILIEGLQLRFLSWYSYPLTSWRENFSAENLVILKLRRGKMEKLWDGVKNLVNLKEFNLRGSKMLKELPDLSKATNLEVLLLWGCSMLTTVHPSIFSLGKLETLDLFNCKSLTSLSSSSHLCSLSYLNLDNCRNLREFSIISENMRELGLQHTMVKELASSFEQQSQLKVLRLTGSYIERLPSSFNNLTQLLSLELTSCIKLQEIGELPSSLESLNVRNCKLLKSLPQLPESLKILNASCCKSLETLAVLPASLKTLDFRSCSKLKTLTELPQSFKTLDVSHCRLLKTLPELPKFLETLNVQSCSSLETLPELPQCLETLDVRSCSSLETLPKLHMSLKTLNVHGCCSLKILPELPQFLETLDVRSCFSLVTLPKLHMSLKTLNVHGCCSLETLPELPQSLEALDARHCTLLKSLPEFPQSLETLDVNGCTALETLPELPQSLEALDVRHCTLLKSLPEFPQSLETLNVNGCTALETLPENSQFLKALDASDCQLLQTSLLLSASIVEQLKENKTRVLFWNCLKLNEHFQKAIELNARINVMKFASHHLSTPNHYHVENYNDYEVNYNHRSYQAVYVYPGSSVPTWLEYKTTNYIIIDPSSAPSSPLLGFIFCFILSEGKVKKDCVKGRLEVHITIGDVEGEGRHENVRIYIDFEGSVIESDHVCVVYDQRCSSMLTKWAKNQTRFQIAVTMEAQGHALPQDDNVGARLGVSPIRHLRI